MIKTLFETLTVVTLVMVTALCALWLQQPWSVMLNGASIGLWAPVLGLVVSMILALGLVIGWNFDRPPADADVTRTATRDVTRKPSLSFTVKKGKRYRANISLGFFEQVASNDMIAGMLEKAGFSDVVVTGTGGSRRAEATWLAADATAQMPAQIVSAAEIPSAPSTQTASAG